MLGFSPRPQQGTKINEHSDNWMKPQQNPTTNGYSNSVIFSWCQQSLHHFYESAGAGLHSWSMRFYLIWFSYRFPMGPVEEEGNKVRESTCWCVLTVTSWRRNKMWGTMHCSCSQLWTWSNPERKWLHVGKLCKKNLKSIFAKINK